MTAVPVFGVSVCSVPRGIDESFSFEKINFETKFEYGTFNLKNGMFTANAPGLYQFHFSALQQVSKINHFTNIELRVDGVKKAEFLSQLIRGKEEYEPISLSSMLTLKLLAIKFYLVKVFRRKIQKCTALKMYFSYTI